MGNGKLAVQLSRLTAVTVVLGGLMTGSFGADGNTPAAGHPSTAPLPPLWSGLYLGLQGRYGSARASGSAFDGMLGGVQAGDNSQFAQNIILGADISRIENASMFSVARSATTRAYALRPAHGRAIDESMVYGTGGFVWAVNEISGSIGRVGASGTQTDTGHGAGREWMITPAWTARAEYLYAHFGSETYFGGSAPAGGGDPNIVRIATR
jgi:outer membrane immunogenic protein